MEHGMQLINFVDLSLGGAVALFVIGFVGGLVSGFIGSGGAFVLTPAMMTLGASGMIAVASNSCHKFPKAIVGVVKRHKYGQVDVKLGLVMAVFAEAGVLFGKHMMTGIRNSFGAVGTDIYVSVIFILVMGIVGGFMLKDYLKLKMLGDEAREEQEITRLARWVQSVRIPGTMFYCRGAQAEISFLFVIPLGFVTGFLSSAIAVGGLAGVPGMIYVLGVPAIMASATEMIIAVATGLGATFLYGLEGAVDIRLAMLILLGSLFGIQLGAIGTTYVKDYEIKFTMAVIMLTVLFSRLFYLPGYLVSVGVMETRSAETMQNLKWIGDGILYLALIIGAYTVLSALLRGMKEHRKPEMAQDLAERMVALAPAQGSLDPAARLDRILLATDGSDFSASPIQSAVDLARRVQAKLFIASVAVYNPEYASTVPGLEQAALEKAQRDAIGADAAAVGLDHEVVITEAPDPYRGIVEAAEEYRADLIVMGRRGRRGLARGLVGDATSLVIGHSPCNVLVVPRGVSLKGKGILVATDGSRYGDAAAWTAGRLAQRFGVPLMALSVVLPSHNEQRRREAVLAIERTKAAFAERGVAVAGIVAEGRPDLMIVEEARKADVDLIVVGTHGRTGIDRLLMGSIAERVIGFADRPVLVVRS